MNLRILVVDNQTMVRSTLATLLSLEPDIEVCGQAGNGREALEVLGGVACSQDSVPAGAICTRPVGVVPLDVEMLVMDSIATCKAIRTGFLGTHVLMLTTFGHPGYVQRSLSTGVSGFVVEDAPSKQLAEAVRHVNADRRVISPILAMETLSLGVSSLTKHETEVLRCVAEGGTLANIASELDLPQETVHNRVSSAMLKTNARTRAQTLRLAIKKGWF